MPLPAAVFDRRGEWSMSEQQYVSYVIENKIALITINNPPMNPLITAVRDQLGAIMRELNEKLDEVNVVILTGAPRLKGLCCRGRHQIVPGAGSGKGEGPAEDHAAALSTDGGFHAARHLRH